MNKLFEKLYRTPLLYAVLLMAAFLLISTLINGVLSLIPNVLLSRVVFTAVQIGLCIALALWTKKKIGRGFTLGITGKNMGKAFLLLGPFYISVLFSALQTLSCIALIDPNAADSEILQGFLTGLISGIRPGITEELICRVCIMGYLVYMWAEKPNGLRRAVWVSAAIFGLAHISNALQADLVPTLMQCMYATAIGALLGAVYARTHNLLALMVGHAAMDVLADIPLFLPVLEQAEQTAETAGASINLASIIFYVLLSLIWAGWALFLLRKKKLSQAQALWLPEALPVEE